MRILIISNSAWDSRNATGNTYVNWFHGEVWEKDVFSNFYLRSAMPNNPVCTDYYRVTPQELLRKLEIREKLDCDFRFSPKKWGKACRDMMHRRNANASTGCTEIRAK